MAEPTSTAGVIVATVSATTLTLLGVGYYALIWAFVGSLLALYQTAPMGRIRTVVFIFLSTLIGAACGTAFPGYFGSESQPMLIISSLVAGAGAQLIVASLLNSFLTQINRFGGK